MFGSNNALYIQIATNLTTEIITREYSLGQKLPTVRELSYKYEVNPLTIQKAYSLLEEKKVVIAKVGSGKYLTEDASKIEKLKRELLNDLIEDFLKKVKSYEFDKEIIIKLIKELYV